jgi:hypothetical protein
VSTDGGTFRLPPSTTRLSCLTLNQNLVCSSVPETNASTDAVSSYLKLPFRAHYDTDPGAKKRQLGAEHNNKGHYVRAYKPCVVFC